MALELDTTQPEIYESPDPPQVSQVLVEEPSVSNEDIDTASLDVSGARKAFRKAEALVASSHNELELFSSLEHESPLQRFQRLQLEVAQLAQDLSSASDDSKVEPDQDITAKDLRKQVQDLESRLNALGSKVGRGNTAAALSNQLLGQLQQFQQQSRQQTQQVEPSSSSAQDQIVYELFYSSDLARNVVAEHAAQLDRRITALEASVGDVRAVQLAAGDLASTVASLGTRLTLIQPEQLAILAGRIKAILPDLDKVITAKKQPTSEVEQKVSTLFDRLDRWDPLVHTLPTLVDRLRSLQTLHLSAATLVDAVQGIARDQTYLKDKLQTHEALLVKVEQNLSTNTATVQKNIDVLDKRVTDLLAKMQTLKKPATQID